VLSRENLGTDLIPPQKIYNLLTLISKMKKEGKPKLFSWAKLIFFIYTFIFSIELIKKTSLLLAPSIKDFLLQNLTPLKAIATGWFTTSIVQSSGAVISVAAAFTGNNLINLTTAVYIIIGASFGTIITALIISLVTVAQKRKDFRHGFEIALSYAIYSALLVTVIFILEYSFKAISRISFFCAKIIGPKISSLKIPNFVESLTSPIVNFLFGHNNKLILLLMGFVILILTLKYMGKSIIDVFGGEKKAKKFINKHFDSKYKAYFIGVVLTGIVFSSSITIGLLVPLAVSRLINLKKALPFIIGAELGTFTDVFLAAIILSHTLSLATAFAYMFFGIIGALIFLPNIEFLYKATKFTSKKLINISRKKALCILIAFILIPLLIILIF